MGSRMKTPPTMPLLLYVVVAVIGLTVPEYSYSDHDVIQGSHQTVAFVQWTAVLLSVWMVAAYWWTETLHKAEERGPLTTDWKTHLAFGLIPIAVLAAWCRPLLSVDTFYYVAYGRQLAVLGLNPYEVNLFASANDPIISQIGKMWFHNIAFYGPIALSLYAVPSLIVSSPTLLGLAVTLKFLWLPFYGLLGRLLYRYWEGCPDRLSRTIAVLAGPNLIWYGLVDGHVDLLIVTGLVATALLMKANRPALCALTLSAAASIKIVGIICLPVCFFWWLKHSRVSALRFSLIFVVVYGGLYLVVGGGEYLAVVEFTKLWDNLVAASLVPKLVGLVTSDLGLVIKISNLTFYLGIALLCGLTWTGRFEQNPALVMGWAMGLLFLTRTYFQPWYTLWFWALLWIAAPTRKDFKVQYGLWSVTVIAAWLIPWEFKGYFVGSSALVGLIIAAKTAPTKPSTTPGGEPDRKQD
ncbi:MAG TPA: hypothetical protein EYO33_17990 [Phycisphaerales bacterium]|nr:hypothetical protein [Phycisphaerales bacterium]